MSLRPRNGAPNPGRGGDGRRRRWSESPIPRVGKRRVKMTGAPGLLYWWKMDDASGSATEAGAGPSLAVDAGTIAYHQSPLAPRSTYAISIDSATDASMTAEFTTGLGAASDGWIVFDLWATLAEDATWWESHSSAEAVFAAYNATAGGAFYIYVGNSWTVDANQPAHLIFEDDHGIIFDYAGWPSTAHIQWKIHLANGVSRIVVNGVQKDYQSGLTFTWDHDDAWSLGIGSTVATDSAFDEIKVFGTERP